MEFSELFAVDSKATLVFFYQHLKEFGVVLGASGDELLHVASILASYAQASPQETDFLPPLPDLSAFFDRFVFLERELRDVTLLEQAGAQNLFLNGFFRDQMRQRHNVAWYDTIGQEHYWEAMRFSQTSRRRQLFRAMSIHFPIWTQACCKLHRRLREERYLIRPN